MTHQGSGELGATQNKDKGDMRDEEEDESAPYDPNNLESCKAFLDAKRKLRLVLSTADFQVHV